MKKGKQFRWGLRKMRTIEERSFFVFFASPISIFCFCSLKNKRFFAFFVFFAYFGRPWPALGQPTGWAGAPPNKQKKQKRQKIVCFSMKKGKKCSPGKRKKRRSPAWEQQIPGCGQLENMGLHRVPFCEGNAVQPQRFR